MKPFRLYKFFITAIFVTHVQMGVVFCSQSSFKDAFNAFDADFAAHVIANIAKQTYKETQYNQQDFDYGSSVLESMVTLNGDREGRTWIKKPFRGEVKERKDTWGSAYMSGDLIVFGFHGSFWLADWVQNSAFNLVPAVFVNGNIHQGFNEIVNAIFDDMLAVSHLMTDEDIGNKEIIFTGHSLGGALATLAGSKFLTYATSLKANQVKIITFSAPRVGDKEFVECVSAIIPQNPPNILNLVCNRDIIPHLPLRYWMRYENLGLWIDVLSMEQRLNKVQKGIQYWKAGGIDRRSHVFMRFWRHPILDACVNVALVNLSKVLFKSTASTQNKVMMFGLFCAKTSLALFGESALFFHEIPTKDTIRCAWASAQMSVLHNQSDNEMPIPSMALYHERYPLIKWFYQFFT